MVRLRYSPSPWSINLIDSELRGTLTLTIEGAPADFDPWGHYSLMPALEAAMRAATFEVRQWLFPDGSEVEVGPLHVEATSPDIFSLVLALEAAR